MRALQIGQYWKWATQLSHTQACRQGSSTMLTAALWHTTQSLQPSSSTSRLALGAGVVASSLGWPPLRLWSLLGASPTCPPSADMKRDCRTLDKLL